MVTNSIMDPGPRGTACICKLFIAKKTALLSGFSNHVEGFIKVKSFASSALKFAKSIDIYQCIHGAFRSVVLYQILQLVSGKIIKFYGHWFVSPSL